MVGFHPERRQLTKRDYSIAGASSGFVTRMVSQPLDVLKIRFQVKADAMNTVNCILVIRCIIHMVSTLEFRV